MTDEIKRARKALSASGEPWETFRAISLLLATWPQMLAVVEAASEMRDDCASERRCGSYPCGICSTVDAFRAVVRERLGAEDE